MSSRDSGELPSIGNIDQTGFAPVPEREAQIVVRVRAETLQGAPGIGGRALTAEIRSQHALAARFQTRSEGAGSGTRLSIFDGMKPRVHLARSKVRDPQPPAPGRPRSSSPAKPRPDPARRQASRSPPRALRPLAMSLAIIGS
jgi:hypothetical protein